MGNQVDISRDMLAPGVKVEINPRADKTRKLITQGEIKDILTSTKTHPHGILVRLGSGEIGRVKSILS
jgi:uncharacterized repeat protein (TIGR03833 family)